MRYFLIVCLLSYAIEGMGQWSSDSLTLLQERLSFWNEETPGASLQIVRDGIPLFEQAFGMSDLEHAEPNHLETLFEAGSVSKQFTAAGVLRLIQKGKLGLEDDVRKYIPELPDYGSPIQVYHLLTHTSGIKDWGTVVEMGGWPRTTRVYQQAHVYATICRQKTLNFKPGTAFAYSNSNHNLMVLLIERISGLPFDVYTRQEIFEPAGMKHTSWRMDFRDPVPNRSIAYQTKGQAWSQFMPFENTYGHAALLTTTGDLIAWNAWVNGQHWGPEFERLRLLPYTLENGQQTEYTCGALFVRNIGGTQEICHTGSTAGYRSWLAYYPEYKLSVAYLSNDASVPSIALARLVSDFFIGAHPQKLPMFYNPEASGTRDVEKAGLYKQVDGPQVLEWVLQEDSLYLRVDPQWNGMYNDPWKTGQRTYSFHDELLEVSSPEGKVMYQQVEYLNWKDERLEDLPGRYYSEEAGGQVIITREGHAPFCILHFEDGRSLRFMEGYVQDGQIFLSDGAGLMLGLTLDSSEQITGFSANLSQQRYALSRADNLWFERKK